MTISPGRQAIRGQTPREGFQRGKTCQLPRKGDLVLCVEPDSLLLRGPRRLGCRRLSSQPCSQELSDLLLTEPAMWWQSRDPLQCSWQNTRQLSSGPLPPTQWLTVMRRKKWTGIWTCSEQPQNRDQNPAAFETNPHVFGRLLYHLWNGWFFFFFNFRLWIELPYFPADLDYTKLLMSPC